MSHRGPVRTASCSASRAKRCSCVVVSVGGEIDLSNVDEIRAGLRAQIDQAPHDARIVVDCKALTFIDSRGLHMMAALQRDTDEADRLLTWRNVSPSIQKLIEIAAFDRLIKLETSMRGANGRRMDA